ncbi:glycosyltransferase [Pseudomonas sp. UM16]|uniref:glycosyltransferase n=1 Tax=Pseudomonas sp. UM16 TaxID=3158962 RepID=UPI00398FD718
MNERALVSIAIAAFNPEFFRRALLSAVGQDYAHLEIVICDDSSGNEIELITNELAEQSPVRLRYLRNTTTLGFARNLQQCLEQASGQFIKFLCDDDVLFAGCISRQAQILAACPEVSLVINQRLLCAADDSLLPSRASNCVISPGSAVLKGGDLLEIIAEAATNLFGGISHALFRRSLVQEYLPTLVQDGQGFVARLDLALYACLLRRGHLACINQVLSLERMHAAQLSHHTSMCLAFKSETDWLVQMLASRTGEPAPATGWVRYVPLERYCAGLDIGWEEFELQRMYTGQLANYQQQVGTSSLSFAQWYAEWLECRSLCAGQLRMLPKRIELWPIKPRIVPVISSCNGDDAALRITLESLAIQSYAPSRTWISARGEVKIPDIAGIQVQRMLLGEGFEQLNQRLTDTDELDWVLLLQAGDRLHPHALVIMAERMAVQSERLCLYTDEGANDNLQASAPVFKPDFNLDLMRSMPYVGRLLAFNCQALREAGGFNDDFGVLAPQDLLWRLVETRGLQVVEHIAELLVQCQVAYADWLRDPACQAQAPRILQAHLQRLGVAAQVQQVEGTLMSRVSYLHEVTPSVSILINAGCVLQALVRCVESIFERTAYGNYEVLIVVKGDEPDPIRQWLGAMRELGSDQLRILEVDTQGAAKSLNQASQQARGDYLLLLDSSCVMLDEQWLSELISHGQRPEVGVVGPKLCGANGKVLGAGLVLGLHGPANSPFEGSAVDAGGYMNRLSLVQNWSAVSQDCMLVRREVFLELDGLDTDTLQCGLFDVDFCLRVRELGYLVVWTPFAWVAKSADVAPRELRRDDKDAFYQRWLSRVAQDPAYNHNLSLKQSCFNLEPGLRSGWDPFISRALPHVLALPINTTAIGHYRVAQPFSELESAGWIQGRINYGTPGMIELEREKPDVIIVQCRYSPAAVEECARIKRFSSARRIYEIDDYIIDVPQKNDHGRNMPGNMRELVSRAIGLCDRLVVSTEPLADALSCMHTDIRVVPNMLAAPLWSGLVTRRQTSARPRVGWAGGTSHRGDLELIADVVKALADEVDWVFFGMCPQLLRPYVKEFHKGVPLALYPRKLASLNLDLALAPLEVNLFNDCKSNLRLLEYGACGFPVICTDTKAYTGYLPCTRVSENTTEQWLAAIRMHLDDPQASYRQGDALREAVLRDYVLMPHNLQQWANAWLAD